MPKNMFLLKNIIDPDYQISLSVEEKEQVNDYLRQMHTGAPDGNIDGEWQSDGMGYYVHLHIIENLEQEERYAYQLALIEDATVWLAVYPNNYMVQETISRLKLQP
ncbi:MAG: hypothetical protein ACSHWT_11420 [Glaciecola sp.]|jgi:hypothetical protein